MQRILTQKDGHYYFIDSGTGDLQAIRPQLPPKAHILGADLSPDGKYVVFAVQLDRESLESDVIGRSELYIVGSDGKAWQLTNTPEIVEYDPVWSRDGRHLAFIDFHDQVSRQGSNGLFVGEMKCK